MEYYSLTGPIFFDSSFRNAALFILFLNPLVSGSMWIWTKGCWRGDSHTFNFTLSDNLPHTCFKACGQHTSTVALQDKQCYCQPKTLTRSGSRDCKACDHNEMVTCGSSEGKRWSLYRKANHDELAEHGIESNVSGCIIYNEQSFRVENCSRTGLYSLCTGLFRNTNCDYNNGKWSQLACANSFDRLVDSFVDNVQGCDFRLNWIGLFALDEQSLIEEMSSTPAGITSSLSLVDLSSIDSSELYPKTTEMTLDFSQFVTSTKIISESHSVLPDIAKISHTLAATLKTSNLLPDSFTTDSSVSFTEQVQTYSTAQSVNIISYSTHTTNVNIIQESTSATPYRDYGPSLESKYISPTQASHFQSFYEKSYEVHSSFTSMSHVLVKPEITYTTQTLSHLPITLVSTKYPTAVQNDSKIIYASSSFPNKHQTSIFATISPMSEKSINHPMFTSMSKSSTLLLSFERNSLKASESSSFTSVTPTPGTILPTITKTKGEHPDTHPKSASNVQESESKIDLEIALCVVGAMAVFALAVVGILALYIKRSLGTLKIAAKRTSTLTDDPPNIRRVETSFDEAEDNLPRNNTYSDLEEPSFCSRGIRADLQSYGAWSSSFLYNGRQAVENEYVLY